MGQAYGPALRRPRVEGFSLSIDSEPKGSSAFVNGRLVGPTPVELVALKSGAYSVRLEKDGYQVSRTRVSIKQANVSIACRLEAVSKGRLQVDIKPDGAEVLLDGKVVGLTPLVLTDILEGHYELSVRRTNFEPYIKQIQIQKGLPAVFKDIELHDKILAMLKLQVKTEPQRVSHYAALGHYLFVNDKLKEAADVYAQGVLVAATPIEFGDGVPPEERILEQRLRGQDVRRLNDELRKKKHYAGKDVSMFRAQIEKSQDEVARNHVESWAWVHQSAQNMVKERKLAQAEKLYLRHMETVKDQINLAQAYTELITVRLKMHNLSGVRESFHKFVEKYRFRADLLRQAANRIYGAHNAFRGEERMEVLGLSEKMLVMALDATKHREMRALCTFELANVFSLQARYKEALLKYQESIAGTTEPSTKELRSLKMAACHMKLRAYAQARALYEGLLKSSRQSTQRMAEQGLQALQIHEKRK